MGFVWGKWDFLSCEIFSFLGFFFYHVCHYRRGNMWPTYVVGVIRSGLLTLNNVALLYGHGAQLIHSQRLAESPQIAHNGLSNVMVLISQA